MAGKLPAMSASNPLIPDFPPKDTGEEQPAEEVSAEDLAEKKRQRHLKELLAFGIMLLLVSIAVFQLPKIIRSIGLELVGRQSSQLYEFPTGKLLDPEDERMLVDSRDFYTMSFLSIDEAKGILNFVISGNRQCSPNPCHNLQVIIYSMHAVEPYRRGLPPSMTFNVSADEQIFSQPGQLPLIGQPSLYPLDKYDLRIAVSIVKLNEDGTKDPYTEEEYEQISISTVRNAVHNFLIMQPTQVDPASINAIDDPYPFIGAMDVQFARPTYLKVLAVMLVLMIAISSVITMFTRTVGDALLSIGGIVIGVWGVRSILVPSSVSVITAIDIALSMVIFFLLLGIGFRIVKHLFHQSDLPDPIPVAKKVVQRPRRDLPLT